MSDHVLVVTLCMVCPFEPAEKQALLEAPSPADRGQALLALLQIDTHTTQADQAGDARRRFRTS